MKRITKLKKIDPFLYELPHIDVHGYDEKYTLMCLNTLIEESLFLEKYDIYIIHGKGMYILKKSIHEYLKHDNRVEEYHIYSLNDGITIITLKKNWFCDKISFTWGWIDSTEYINERMQVVGIL